MSDHLHSKSHFHQKHVNPGIPSVLQNLYVLLSVALMGNFNRIFIE